MQALNSALKYEWVCVFCLLLEQTQKCLAAFWNRPFVLQSVFPQVKLILIKKKKNQNLVYYNISALGCRRAWL